MLTRTRSIATCCFRAAPIFLTLLVLTGCVGGAWNRALDEDTPAAYYRFIRDHGDSKYAGEANERLKFHKLKRNPTMNGFEAFRKQYPGSPLIAELQPILEKPAFDAARSHGTAVAYRAFLADFPDGALAARAEGNAVYVEAKGYGGNAAQLGSFANRHPASDFAAEAQRTVEAVSARRAGQFDRVGLLFHINASTPEKKRIASSSW